MNNIIIFTDSQKSQGRNQIDWQKIGTVVSSVAELYQQAKEKQVDILLADANRHDLTQAVATRVRRSNGETEIWQLIPAGQERVKQEEFAWYLDGLLSLDLGQSGITKKVKQILADKELLSQFSIVGRSPKMKLLANTIDRVAPTDVSVLVVGASGSGKEIVARALHMHSNRADRPFVTINCGALSEGLLESELFGHEKGAFTGSVSKREGLFHKADGGTLFLDEIGETKPSMQVKLLRVLEDGTYYPVGSSDPQRSDVRIIAATNRDLTEAIAEGEFREDLYFRIATVKLMLPSLFERRADIQPLLHHFWSDQPQIDYSLSALERLMQYDWPGNVRQLKNFALRMTALKPEGLVETDDVDKFISEQHTAATHLPVSTGRSSHEVGQELIYRAILSLGNEVKMLRNLITSNLPGEDLNINGQTSSSLEEGATMEQMEEVLIRQVLAETGGNRKETARRLGIGERTLYRKLTKYKLK